MAGGGGRGSKRRAREGEGEGVEGRRGGAGDGVGRVCCCPVRAHCAATGGLSGRYPMRASNEKQCASWSADEVPPTMDSLWKGPHGPRSGFGVGVGAGGWRGGERRTSCSSSGALHSGRGRAFAGQRRVCRDWRGEPAPTAAGDPGRAGRERRCSERAKGGSRAGEGAAVGFPRDRLAWRRWPFVWRGACGGARQDRQAHALHTRRWREIRRAGWGGQESPGAAGARRGPPQKPPSPQAATQHQPCNLKRGDIAWRSAGAQGGGGRQSRSRQGRDPDPADGRRTGGGACRVRGCTRRRRGNRKRSTPPHPTFPQPAPLRTARPDSSASRPVLPWGWPGSRLRAAAHNRPAR